MEKIIMDFAFGKHSLLHGQFLVECHETCPGIEVKDVTYHYSSMVASGNVVLCVEAPEELAVVLKLRFGQCMKERPPAPTKDIKYDIQSISRQLKMKNYNKIRIIDYDDPWINNKHETADAKERTEDLYKSIKLYFDKNK